MTIAMRIRTLAAAGAAALLLAATFAASGQDAKPEVSRVRLAVGGKPALFYLPLTVTERLGYFRDAGRDVEISDFPGGARALQALIGGSADVVTGSCVDGPRLARDNFACRTEVACSHVSGLFTQSGWTAGPDGVREPRPHHSSGSMSR